MINKSNPFLKAYENAKRTGQVIAHMISKLGLFQNNKKNFIGFSLGTVLVFELLQKLSETNQSHKVGDVLLLGSCIEKEIFETQVWRLLKKNGLLEGKIKVAFS